MTIRFIWFIACVFSLSFLVSCGGDGETSVDCEMTARIYELGEEVWAVSVTDGTEPFTYIWSTGAATSEITITTSGDYTVTVTDNEGCTADHTVGVEISETGCDEFRVIVSEDQGSINTEVTGGTEPYTYSWNTGELTPSILVTTDGIYEVEVTDAEGCVERGRVEAGGGGAPCDDFFIRIDNTESSSLTVYVDGGTPPYTYMWSNGALTQTISGLEPGVYELTVTDAEACEVVERAEVHDETDCLTFSAELLYDESQMTVTAVISGGTAPYFYRWSTGEETETISVVSGETYEVTVGDLLDCLYREEIVIP